MAALCAQEGMWPMPSTRPVITPVSLPIGSMPTYVNTFAAPNHDRLPWISDIEDGVVNSVTDERNDWTLITFSVPYVNLPWIAVNRNGETGPFGGNVHFESIDFDNRFSVSSHDRRSAVMLIDQGMMLWLLELDQINFEINGPLVSAFVKLRHPDSPVPVEVSVLFRFYAGLAAHIPQIVRSEYATPGSNPAS